MSNEIEGKKSESRPIELQRTKKAEKLYAKLPRNVGPIVDLLEADIRETAGRPYGRGWKSFGEVILDSGEKALHCHLNLHYVAIWLVEDIAEKIICKFIWFGSRENAPY